MDIVYAAERHSIAKLLGDYVKQDVRPEEILVRENPNETGSFIVGWRLQRYVLSPCGQIAPGRCTPHRFAVSRGISRTKRLPSEFRT